MDKIYFIVHQKLQWLIAKSDIEHYDRAPLAHTSRPALRSQSAESYWALWAASCIVICKPTITYNFKRNIACPYHPLCCKQNATIEADVTRFTWQGPRIASVVCGCCHLPLGAHVASNMFVIRDDFCYHDAYPQTYRSRASSFLLMCHIRDVAVLLAGDGTRRAPEHARTERPAVVARASLPTRVWLISILTV